MFNPDYIVDLYPMPDGRLVCVMPLTYNRARICVGPDKVQIEQGW